MTRNIEDKNYWPCWYHDGAGASAIFERIEDVPDGWVPAWETPTKATGAASGESRGPDPFDHDGDGKPGGSKPKAARKPRKSAATEEAPNGDNGS